MKLESEQTMTQYGKSVKMIAHRGSHTEAYENTIASFEAAICEGADSFECDVRFSKDGEPIIFHDRTVLRLTGLPIPVKSLSSKHLQMLAGPRRQIPGLQAVLELLQENSIHCYLDLKISDLNQVAKVIEMVKT